MTDVSIAIQGGNFVGSILAVTAFVSQYLAWNTTCSGGTQLQQRNILSRFHQQTGELYLVLLLSINVCQVFFFFF